MEGANLAVSFAYISPPKIKYEMQVFGLTAQGKFSLLSVPTRRTQTVFLRALISDFCVFKISSTCDPPPPPLSLLWH